MLRSIGKSVVKKGIKTDNGRSRIKIWDDE